MDDWKETRIFVNGIHINFARKGESQKSLVMLHGITDNGLCWSRLARSLVQDFDIILVDARGHGKSDRSAGKYTYDNMAEDIAQLIEQLKLHRPFVIGHSMGAQTTAVLASRNPGIAGKLVLEDPPWRLPAGQPADRRGEFAQRMKADILHNQELDVQELTLEKMAESPQWDDDEFPYWSESKHEVCPEIPGLVLQANIPYTETVPKINIPTLLVTGDPESGAIVTSQLAEEIEKLNPNFQTVKIPNAGHNIRRENFPVYLEAVKAFLLA